MPMDDMSGDDDVQDINMEDTPLYPEHGESPQNSQNPPTKPKTSDDGLPKGFFKVEAILKHKFQQGWKFLTKWENYPLSTSTWEPPKSFKLGKNLWNEVFVQYCKQKGLQVSDNGSIKDKKDENVHFCNKKGPMSSSCINQDDIPSQG